MERFFDLFPDRRLADLFMIVEDARIDVMIGREYTGIRRPYGARQERELERRAEIRDMPLRQAFVENLLRVSLGGIDQVLWPEALMPVATDAIGIIRLLQHGATSVHPRACRRTVRRSRTPQAEPRPTSGVPPSKTPPRPPSSSTSAQSIPNLFPKWTPKTGPSSTRTRCRSAP